MTQFLKRAVVQRHYDNHKNGSVSDLQQQVSRPPSLKGEQRCCIYSFLSPPLPPVLGKKKKERRRNRECSVEKSHSGLLTLMDPHWRCPVLSTLASTRTVHKSRQGPSCAAQTHFTAATGASENTQGQNYFME